MGLSIIPLKPLYDDSVDFSYRGFGEFRRTLAAAIGIDLDVMVGFGGETDWPSPDDEPLVYLLHHSDCDGVLDYAACDAIHLRLREVAAKAFPELVHDPDAVLTSEVEWMRERAFALADACENVAKGDYSLLEFS